jgi:hypothetical protein
MQRRVERLVQKWLRAVLDEGHPPHAHSLLAAFVGIDQRHVSAGSRQHDPQRQTDVAAPADDDDIVPLHRAGS